MSDSTRGHVAGAANGRAGCRGGPGRSVDPDLGAIVAPNSGCGAAPGPIRRAIRRRPYFRHHIDAQVRIGRSRPRRAAADPTLNTTSMLNSGPTAADPDARPDLGAIVAPNSDAATRRAESVGRSSRRRRDTGTADFDLRWANTHHPEGDGVRWDRQ